MDTLDTCCAFGCGAPWNKEISLTVPLCRYHFAEAWAAYANWDEATMAAWVQRVAPENRSRAVRQTRPGGPVVYYVAMNGMVKIGTSTWFVRRMGELYVQPSAVLAIEPGGRKVETSRHQQFQYYRKRGTELFEPNRILTELIDELKQRYPDPWTAAIDINRRKSSIVWKSDAERTG